jgi:hypothetical protein
LPTVSGVVVNVVVSFDLSATPVGRVGTVSYPVELGPNTMSVSQRRVRLPEQERFDRVAAHDRVDEGRDLALTPDESPLDRGKKVPTLLDFGESVGDRDRLGQPAQSVPPPRPT